MAMGPGRERQMSAWRRWHAEQLHAALDGPHCTVVKQIIKLLGNLTPRNMPDLLKFMRMQDWHPIDADTRFILLHEINSAITELREREGKPSFDDALPGGRDTLFQIA